MRVRIPTDVPTHRPSVGADPTNMGSLMPPRIVKPYTYRGTGYDTLTPHLGEDWELGAGAPMPESRRAKVRKKPKPRKRKRTTHAQIRERIDAAAYRKYQRSLRPPARHEVERIDGAIPMPAPPPPPERPRKIRATPGWQPMTGADIDSLLDQLG